MARKTSATSRKRAKPAAAPYLGDVVVTHRYCTARFPRLPKPRPDVHGNRLRLIRESEFKWLNGTTITYCFYNRPARWKADGSQKDVVRRAFALWKSLGIGLEFVEVAHARDADVRIAFDQSDGSWSCVGTDALNQPRGKPTMNFGWSLTEDPAEGLDTALHEIGHALGFPHEHQNPIAGIEWNEKAVYRSLAAAPNRWSRATTFRNIIEKIAPDTVTGSSWDPNSVMHYPFEAGLILRPERYRRGLTPRGGLSARDRKWVRHFYPPIRAKAKLLKPFQSTPLALSSGQQAEFTFTPDATRRYSFATFGEADTQLAIRSGTGGQKDAIAEDDDSGTARNARVAVRLEAGRPVRVQVRMRYIADPGNAALMAW